MVIGGMVDGLVDGLRVVALAVVDLMRLSVVGVLDVHDSARVGIINLVCHGLEAAVGEGNMVAAVGRVAVPGLVGTKLDGVLVVVVGVDTILVFIMGWGLLVGWLMVGGGVLVYGSMVGGAVEVGRGGQSKGQECGEGKENLR